MLVPLGNFPVSPQMVEAARDVLINGDHEMLTRDVIKEMLEAALKLGPSLELTVVGRGGSGRRAYD